ncbi:hypothetical protein TNIN_299681 [Trichonephila inaurata madagascariensis]|uniref:Uncharacterized protein n=1 Tax=Trichonephila inaurata madagascariensis TaxID=2747483 RepID=A0A8X6X553_9ARAC|nr:hypothetical protein TNIN_299681 [Trichonephila inaurata madagascariensis]
MFRKNLSVQGALTIFEELPSDDDSSACNSSDTDYEDYVENLAQKENISSDDEEMDEIQCPSTSQLEVKCDKLYIKNRSPPEFTETYTSQNRGSLYRRSSLCSTRKDVHRSR